MNKMTMSEAGRLGGLKTHQVLIQRYADNPKFCTFCKNQLPYKKRHNKFCDQSCNASYNNQGVCRNKVGNAENFILEKIKVENEKVKIVYKEQLCLNCNNQLFHIHKRTYCSAQCQQQHIWNLRKKQIELEGHISSVRCAKRYLIETRGVRCEICGIDKWCDKPVPLIMDHIDGHHENNKLDNLRLVCGNCDMQLPTYKSKNKGNGRAYRRQRYAEEKSF